MKKIFLFAFLILLARLANAQSKIDSAIKKTDTIINKQNEQLNITKGKINSIQDSIKNLLSQREFNQSKINDYNRDLLDFKKKVSKSKADYIRQNKINDNLNKIIDKNRQVNKDLSEQKEDLNKEITSAKSQLDSINNEINKKTKENILLAKGIKGKQDTISTSIKTLKLVNASIINQLDSSETVATMEMLDSTFIYPAKDTIKTKIKKVHINTMQGIILEIIVTTDKGVFRNKGNAKNGGIVIADLLHFEKFTEKRLYKEMYTTTNPLEEKEEGAYVLLKDVIRYTPVSSYTDAVYGEFEITLPSVKGDKIYLIKESTSINTYFNIAAFTDIKGISGEPNGIAQFTADAKFMLNTKAISRTSIVEANYISFQGGLSKFDSEFKGTQLGDKNEINRKDLLQRSTYKLGVKLNILKGYLPPVPVLLYNTIELNVGYNVMGSKVFTMNFKDAAKTVIDTTFKTVTQNQWYAEPTITFSRRKNFSMCLALPLYLNNVKKSATILNNHTEYWAVPGISLMYFGKRDVGSKIFFRYNHYINIKDKTQAFSQMQLGYSLNLTQVLDK